ncbi:translation initiation factor IF-2 N-terminal domain-containing protein [Rhodococcus pyridinivorans]|uniref:Translation initiation factor IF-2 N-terminal domain-containing protein n=1 Tax=Rhodococcus pyridinivorans TaxID=103816 RepID=A0A7M2XGN1_9NOCA|nr:translation initiation factor IF-2 N-terminal domain-containing protein [Rhodococcus pyridinivorans]QOV96799.1 translation initiation factor IF-2 N-terminal domain-containing protein [Rhodococcus pyridinivorans]WMM70762.1 translation initiation factor IF-2 N-terminal domain-containing protein [Rhodococcus pyridinivorans]
MSNEMRVHELAKELGISSKDLLAQLLREGEFVKLASSTLRGEVVQRMRMSPPSSRPPYPLPIQSPPRPRTPAPNKPKPAMTQSQLITAVEAGQILGLRPDRIRQWASRGYIQGKGKRGRATLYDRDDLRQAQSETRSRTKDPEVFPQLRIPGAYYNRLITTNEVAALFGVAPSTVRSWIRRGHLTPARRGKHGWLFKIGLVMIAADDRARNRTRRW